MSEITRLCFRHQRPRVLRECSMDPPHNRPRWVCPSCQGERLDRLAARLFPSPHPDAVKVTR